jgi:glucose-1-phosphate thymidylyltransferase
VPDLPFSKSLYPLPVQEAAETVIHTPLSRLLSGLEQAAVDRAFVVGRRERADLIEYIASRSMTTTFPIAYVVTTPTPSVAHTIVRAAPFLGRAEVMLAYPDIVFEPANLPALLAAAKAKREADVMLALVPTERPDRCDTVEVDDENRVTRIFVKSSSGPPQAWILAIWNSRFTEFLTDYVAEQDENGPELQVSAIFLAAQRAGFSLLAERFSGGRFLDLGTPDALMAAARFLRSDRER